MTSPIAFQATYADWKLVKTRGVVQVIFEVPLSGHDEAYQVVGGMPDPAKERWFGIAALVPQAAKETSTDIPIRTPATPSLVPDKPSGEAKRQWRDMQPAQQAGIRCAEPVFAAFLKEKYPEEWRALEGNAAELVRFICGINSRAQINTSVAAKTIWLELDGQFQAWKALENV